MNDFAQDLLSILEFFLINWLGRHSITSGYYQISFVACTGFRGL